MRRILVYSEIVGIGVLVLSLLGCGKDDLPANPFDSSNDNDSTSQVYLEPTSIEGLHQNIFKPTCANSGCHDGTFEPDFRTVESSYYTLVYHDIIKQNPSNPMDYRVQPGDADNSILMERLTVDIGGNSGIMPLAVDPNSDWEANKSTYLQNISDWINDGAKDIFGNATQSINIRPQLQGLVLTAAGSLTPLSRNIEGYVEVPNGTNALDVYLAIDDKETAVSALVSTDVQLSLSFDDFTNVPIENLAEISPQNFMGYAGNMIPFQFKLSISNPFLTWSPNDKVFLNVLVDDGDNGAVGLPGVYAMEHIKQYYAFQLMP